MPQPLSIDTDYLLTVLRNLLAIPSPTGYTDEVVRYVCGELETLGIPYELTRRGAIRANLKGRQESPDRALVAHVDTLGAQVKSLKDNGRLALVPIGHWSSRFAEGARCTVFTDTGRYRGTVLPLKASGHTFGDEVDEQPTNWQSVELRVDAPAVCRGDLDALGFNVGDFVAIDPQPEFPDTGFIVSRHLDDKAGAAAALAAAKAVMDARAALPVDCHLLFTISEEVGSGASTVLHQDVAEMVTIDNGTPALGQNSRETGVTIAMADSTGPFDYSLTHRLLALCREHGIPHQRDVFRYYRCDSAAAIEAGNDIRTALVCFGVDASHGYERTHVGALESLCRLLTLYMQCEPEGPLRV
ncbi:osmoprotectant NAGGN system M42 family peptidase [Azospirillum halopraeferens]|uniref:osmoprotectant NAGGN system M42 family peptidase n=1 Tax=Azospirillum halopraeferens TaxID=34010 RepID=UPI000429E57A|nr:osmoprotectant NAGGN system M42 family peptidase [Azospirillum halopraeferens]